MKGDNKWIQAISRFILAGFIGIVVATPIELRIFKNEIEAKIIEINLKRATDIERIKNDNTELEEQRKSKQYESIRKKYNLEKLEEEENKTKIDYDKLDKQRIQEAEGTAGTGKVGKGPVYAEKLASFGIAKKNWEDAQKALNNARKKYDDEISGLPKVSNNNNPDESDKDVDGAEARVNALYQLSGMHWFITILFILIECLPVLSKLMTKKSSYEEVLNQIEDKIMCEQRELQSVRHTLTHENLKRAEEAGHLSGEVFLQKNKDKLDAELKANRVILNKIAECQQELALMALEKWYDKEKERVEANYIKSKPILENIRWRATNLTDAIYFYFNSSGELEYTENGTTEKGSWKFVNPDREIEIELSKVKEIYTLHNFSIENVDLDSRGTIIHLSRV
ncbi:hypothetical protein AGMMS49574_01870 [Bacteroidia bacterium]|nr:hypothetical protein AGMMS49574_01870 [Bacteroidia bacterium]